jgi:hypothetical protein
MLGSCPNTNSKEWQDLLALNNGNVQRAREEWDLLYGFDQALNSDPNLSDIPVEVFEDESVDEFIEEPSFDRSLKKVKIFLKTKQYELNRKKVQNQRAKQYSLNRIIKQLNELEGVEAINAFIEHAYMEGKETRKVLFDALKKNRQDEINSKELLDILSSANQFANGYNILDEISKEDIDRYFSKPVSPNKPESELTPQDKLSIAIQTRNNIKTVFDEKVIDVIAETLIAYRSKRGTLSIQEGIKASEDKIKSLREDTTISDKAREREIAFQQDELKKRKALLLDKESLAQLLRETSKNENVFDAYLNPLISSGDAPLSLFATMIKTQFESTRVEDIQERDNAVDKLREFVEKTGRKTSNVAELNEGIYEELIVARRDVRGKLIKDPKTNEVIFDKVMSFVQKYDMNKFQKAELEFYKENPKPKLKEDASDIEKKQHETALDNWYKKKNTWYDQNTQAKSTEEINKIKNEKEKEFESGIITDDEFAKWQDSRIKENKKTGAKKFRFELAEPSEKYLSDKWLKLYNKEGKPITPVGEMHEYLVDKYLKYQELLPVGQRKGYILPSIEMDDAERVQRFGVKAAAKSKISETFKKKKYDQELYGEQAGQTEEIDRNVYGIGTSSGEKFDIIPTYFTQYMDADDVSVDLVSTVLRFGAAARRYNALNEVQSEIYAFQKVIGNRTIAAKDSKGRPVMDSFAKKMGYEDYIKDNGMDYSQFHIDQFINMVIKGESQKSQEWMNIELSKVTDTLMSISAITTLSMDLLKGVANNLQGNIQLVIESAGSQYFSLRNYGKGKAVYYSKLGGCISDFGKPYPESWLGRLIDYYDAMQGTFKDEYGRDVTASMAQKLFRTNTLFWNQNFGEHEVQVTAMLSLFDAVKVIDKETGDEITLLEAHEKYGTFLFDVVTDENGRKTKNYKVQIRTNQTLENPEGELIDFDEKQRIEQTNILHALNKRMHGVYNEFDKSVLQKYAAGRLLLMYRKYMVPAIKRRYKNLGFDDELGGETEGIYITFWKTLIRDVRTYKFNISKQWATYTPFQKAQIRKVVAELTIIAALAAIIIALTALAGDDDDDDNALKKSWAYNFVLYEAIRMRSETVALLPGVGLRDWYRTVKSPSAMTGTLDRFIKFSDQFLFTWDPEKLEYQRDQGVFNKGDNKSWAYFLKLMGFSGYTFTPDEAIKAFESTYNK